MKYLVPNLKDARVMSLIVLLLCGCGTQAGNPSKPGGSEIVMPEIKFDLPSSVTGSTSTLMLTSNAVALDDPDNCTSLFHCKVRRAHQIVTGVNSVIRRIRDIDRIQSAGTFRAKGPGKNMSGKLEVIVDGEFSRSATMCVNEKVFLHVKWSANNDRIVVTRDFSVNPLGDFVTRPGISRVDVSVAQGQSVLDFRVESEWEIPPGITTDGDILNEHTITTVDSAKSVTIKSVNDWYSSTPAEFEGDHYLTGAMNSEGEGDFVTYTKSVLCPNGFDENSVDLWTPNFSPGNPRWCSGRRVESSGPFSNGELTTVLQELELVGIVSKDTLSTVSFDEGVSCE